MKLSKTKKILLLGATLGILTTSIAVPIVFLNKNEDEQNKKDVESVVKILEEKNEKEKIITLPSDTKGKIIANNQNKIIEKIKILIDKANLNGVKIEVLMQDDANISINAQKIIIKLTKNEISKEVKDFLVKKKNAIDEEIESIKKVLDAKTGKDLIITLSSNSIGNIIQNATNKNAIEKELKILIDPSNTNGKANHSSLKGTTIEVSMSADAPISTSVQNIIVSISKSGGKTLKTTSIFQVKRDFTADEDIVAIKKILESKTSNDLIIMLPSSSTGNIIGKASNKDAIIKKLRILIDPSNTNGDPNHQSLRGTSIEVSKSPDAIISTTPRDIVVSISKSGGTTLRITNTFRVRIFTTDEDIAAIKKILESKTGNDLIITLPSSSTGYINDLNNRNEIAKKLRILIDPSNTNGESNHSSLRGTSISGYAAIATEQISTTLKYIFVVIRKPSGIALTIDKTFRVKKD